MWLKSRKNTSWKYWVRCLNSVERVGVSGMCHFQCCVMSSVNMPGLDSVIHVSQGEIHSSLPLQWGGNLFRNVKLERILQCCTFCLVIGLGLTFCKEPNIFVLNSVYYNNVGKFSIIIMISWLSRKIMVLVLCLDLLIQRFPSSDLVLLLKGLQIEVWSQIYFVFR